ncbi:MAG: hypothetical protein P8J61_08895 [Gammaproteobacteria bacterium]|nr:hypothetical protein [Gammaproteobacteria bacterium]
MLDIHDLTGHGGGYALDSLNLPDTYTCSSQTVGEQPLIPHDGRKLYLRVNAWTENVGQRIAILLSRNELG